MSLIFEYGMIVLSQIVFIYTILPSNEINKPQSQMGKYSNIPVTDSLNNNTYYDNNNFDINFNLPKHKILYRKTPVQHKTFSWIFKLTSVLVCFIRHVITWFSLFILARYSLGIWVIGEQMIQQIRGDLKNCALNRFITMYWPNKIWFKKPRKGITSSRLYFEHLREEDIDWIETDETFNWAFNIGKVRKSPECLYIPTMYHMFSKSDDYIIKRLKHLYEIIQRSS